MSTSTPDSDPLIKGDAPAAAAGSAAANANQTMPPPAPPKDFPTRADFDRYQSVDDMAVPINKIGRRNKTLLASIAILLEGKAEVEHYTAYAVVAGVGRHVLKEDGEKRTKAQILTSYKPTGSLTPLADSLGLGFDYTMTSGTHVLQLSAKLRDASPTVMDSGDEDDAHGVAQVRALGQNLLVLHDNLVSICDVLKDAAGEVERARDAELADINARIQRFHETYGIRFEPRTPPVPLGLQITAAHWSTLESWLPALTSGKQAAVLYRMSEHGMAPKEFHDRCDNKGPTLVIYENSEGNIFGGFVSKSWTSTGGFTSCPGAFIFSLVGPDRSAPPTKFPLKDAGGGHAMYLSSDYHPTFGDIHASSLKMNAPGGNVCTTEGTHYQAPPGSLAGKRDTWWYTDITVVSWPSQ